MGDDGDDGFAPEIKLKSSNDVLDQVDKDTEEVLDFNFVPGSSANTTVLSKDSVDDGIKGDDEELSNGSQEWGKFIFEIKQKDIFLVMSSTVVKLFSCTITQIRYTMFFHSIVSFIYSTKNKICNI